MTKTLVKEYEITLASGSKYSVEADYYILDAGIYYFFKYDQDHQPQEVHQINMLVVRELGSGYKEVGK